MSEGRRREAVLRPQLMTDALRAVGAAPPRRPSGRRALQLQAPVAPMAAALGAVQTTTRAKRELEEAPAPRCQKVPRLARPRLLQSAKVMKREVTTLS